MKPTNQKELFFLAGRLLFLLAIAGGAWFCHTPVENEPIQESQPLQPKQLDPVRQTVWVQVDSLNTLIDKLNRREPNTFEMATNRSEWQLKAVDHQGFERLFLGGLPLANWTGIKGKVIEPLSDAYGFSAPVEFQQGRRFVHLPVLIVQSIQLQFAE